MKNLTKIIYPFIVLVLLCTFSCEKETPSPREAVSTEAQQYFQILTDAEAEAGVSLGLTVADLQAALEEPQALAKVEVCCYTAIDLVGLSSCFGLSTPACLEQWDFNEDGVVNAADLLVLLANYGCPDVEALLLTPSSLFVVDLATGQIRNETLIAGDSWYTNYTTDIFDQVRWYYDGVPVSTTPTHLQLEYPGATDYDVAIDCNSGYHLIELYVRVNCEIYSTSACVKIGIDEVVPFCKSDYCSL